MDPMDPAKLSKSSIFKFRSKIEVKKKGEGQYGAVYEYYDANTKKIVPKKIVKYIKVKDTGFYIAIDDDSIERYKWMIEFCLFVIVMSILMYVDCLLIEDNLI